MGKMEKDKMGGREGEERRGGERRKRGRRKKEGRRKRERRRDKRGEGKGEREERWIINKDGHIHVEYECGYTFIYRIDPDGSCTVTARILNGKRKATSKEEQLTFKKIK